MSLFFEEGNHGEMVVSHITKSCSLRNCQVHEFEKQYNKAPCTLYKFCTQLNSPYRKTIIITTETSKLLSTISQAPLLRTLPAFSHLIFTTTCGMDTAIVILILLRRKLRLKMRRGLPKVTQLLDCRARIQSHKSDSSIHVRC